MAMFTLRDAISLAKGSNTPIGKEVYNSAVKGGYMLTPAQAVNEAQRRTTGKHLTDRGEGLAVGNLPSGKLIDHITFSDESPYSIKGLAAAQGGHWQENPNGGNSYTPSKMVLDRQGEENLTRYFNKYEKGNTLILPKYNN